MIKAILLVCFLAVGANAFHVAPLGASLKLKARNLSHLLHKSLCAC